MHVQFVLGIPGALPADREVLEFELAQLERMLPGATWTAAGIGRHQLAVNEWALELGGHCRTGLEDNLRFDKERLASSNAELVKRVADLTAKFGRSVATPAEARRILGLRLHDGRVMELVYLTMLLALLEYMVMAGWSAAHGRSMASTRPR